MGVTPQPSHLLKVVMVVVLWVSFSGSAVLCVVYPGGGVIYMHNIYTARFAPIHTKQNKADRGIYLYIYNKLRTGR